MVIMATSWVRNHENVERAIKKASSKDAGDYEEQNSLFQMLTKFTDLGYGVVTVSYTHLSEFFYLLHGADRLFLCLDSAWNSERFNGGEFLCCAIGNDYSCLLYTSRCV